MADELTKEIAKELVQQTAGQAYEDVAHPGLRATGDLISFIPRTLKALFSGWETWLLNKEYAMRQTEILLDEKLKNVPEEKLVSPEPYVAIPTIQQLSYSMNNTELREMYANLLASSMNIDTKMSVHPGFVDIIRQLTPDEAKLLKFISKNPHQPVITVARYLTNNAGYLELVRRFTNISEGVCDHVNGIYSYLDNLERLKLIEFPDGVYLKNDEVYAPLENHPFIKHLITEQPKAEGEKIEIERGKFFVTSFGQDFIHVCLN